MARRVSVPDPRPAEQIREQYDLEKRLAAGLRTSTKSERGRLYAEAYDRLYGSLPHHPKVVQKRTSDEDAPVVERQLRWLRRWVRPEHTFLEVGAGDCLVTFAVARLVERAIAIEVSHTIAGTATTPPNFELIISDGVSIPVPPGSVDVVYSQQLMEHLHPDDAREQLENIFRALVPGGLYICVTPNRTMGPHDISRFFDDEATGFHLKEYTIGELARLFREVGFRKVSLGVATSGNARSVPVAPFALLENALFTLPRNLRIAVASKIRPRVLHSFRLFGVK